MYDPNNHNHHQNNSEQQQQQQQQQHSNMNMNDDSDSESLWDELHNTQTHELQSQFSHHTNTRNGNISHNGHVSGNGNGNGNGNRNGNISHNAYNVGNVGNNISNILQSAAQNVSSLASHGVQKMQYHYHTYSSDGNGHGDGNINGNNTHPHEHLNYTPPRMGMGGFKIKELMKKNMNMNMNTRNYSNRNNNEEHVIYNGPYSYNVQNNGSGNGNDHTNGIQNGHGQLHGNNHSHRHGHVQQQQQPSPFDDFGLHTSSDNIHGNSIDNASGIHGSGRLGYIEEGDDYDHELGQRNRNSYDNSHDNSHDDGNGNSKKPLLQHDYGSEVHDHGHGNGNGNSKKFILLDQFHLTPKRDGWGAVANLDLFFTSLYNYYYHRGIIPIIGKGIVELVTLFFTLWLSVFLFAYLDWKELFNCTDEESCHDTLSDYIIDNPLFGWNTNKNIQERKYSDSIWNFVILLYILLFSLYGLFAIRTFYYNVINALEAKYIFEDKLGISLRKLEGGAVEWHDVIKKILELQHSGEYRIAIHGQDIKDELVIAQRIMRKENFMIAFFNHKLLDLTIPLPWKAGNPSNGVNVGDGYYGRSKMSFYSRSLEWSIYFCVLSYMFNHKYQILNTFCMDPLALQRRFIVCGIAHAIFMPFLLFFMTLHFSMQNIYDFRSSQQYLGPREWSNVAKWTFRELNELPHIFERRLGPSYEAAEDYLSLFAPSSFLNSVGRVLVFLSGSLGAVCLALAAVNDAILLHVKLGHWNLLWYVGILGVAYSVGKGMLPKITVAERYRRNLFAEMDTALGKVSHHTHYYPEFWKKRGWDDIIRASFLELFQYKVQLFALEVVSVIVAPLVLCFSLPHCAVGICSFVQNIKMEVPGTGEHCGYATFDFDLFEDESWEGQKINTDANQDYERIGISAQLYSQQRPKAKHGKMEKSFFNFKTAHPEWKCSSSGQDLIDRMETYRTEQAIALARERQHHVAAAARQLETLRALEERQMGGGGITATLNYEERVDENYLGKRMDTSDSKDVNTIESIGPSVATATDLGVINESQGKSSDSNSGSVHLKDDGGTSPPAVPITTATAPSLGVGNISNQSIAASVLHYADIGLSTELQNILNRSTLDPGTSLLGTDLDKSLYDYQLDRKSNTNISDNEEREEQLQKQYMLLEKYHSQTRSSRYEDNNNHTASD